MKRDERSFRVALIADRYVNPPPGGVDGIAVAAEAGWGVIQLPAEDYPATVAGRLLFEVAEQADESAQHRICDGDPEREKCLFRFVVDKHFPWLSKHSGPRGAGLQI